MAENEKVQSSETQTDKQKTSHATKTEWRYDKKINGKTFVTEIYFDKKSKDTFQDKLLKAVQSERKE